MNQKIFFLSTVFTLMSGSDIFAADPNVLGEGKKSNPHAAWTQRPLIGNMAPDTIMMILKGLPFKEGWEFLSVDKTHHNDVDVWRVFASLHGIPVSKDAETAEQVRGEMIEGMKNSLRTEIESAELITPELMTDLLQSAQEKPFLWETLITALQEKYENHEKYEDHARLIELIDEAYRGYKSFDGVSEGNRRAFLIAAVERMNAAVERVNSDGRLKSRAEHAQMCLNSVIFEKKLGFTHDRGTPNSAYDYCVRVAARRNPDGSPSADAEFGQENLNRAAYAGKLGFTQDRGTPNSGYDYLVRIAARRNPDGTPGLGAEHAQSRLTLAAYDGDLGFTGDRGTPTSGYDYLVEVAARRNPDGTPGLGAEYAQDLLIDAADNGILGFTKDRGTPTSGYDYLVKVAARKNPDGTPGLGAEKAARYLLSAFDSE